MSYFEQEYKRRLSLNQDGNALITLISINLIFFVLFAFVNVIYFFSFPQPAADQHFQTDIYTNLALPASLHEFAKRPWTLFTHMFYHYSVWHIISNMLWLWAFGYIMQDLTGTRKLIPVYLYAVVAGALDLLLLCPL